MKYWYITESETSIHGNDEENNSRVPDTTRTKYLWKVTTQSLAICPPMGYQIASPAFGQLH